MITQTFELKLASSRTVKWEGASGEHAAKRYVAMFPNETVIAWRHPKFELRIGMIRMEQ